MMSKNDMESFEARLRNEYAHEGARFERRSEAQPRIQRAMGRQSRARRRRAAVTGALVVVATVTLTATLVSTNAPSQHNSKPTKLPTSTATPVTTSTVPATTTVPLLGRGMQGSATAVPWDKVGAGWFLTLWGPAAGHGPGQQAQKPETTTLFLVDPLGGRYVLKSFSAGNVPLLEGWSGDSRRALLQSGSVVSEIDLANGATLNSFSLAADQSVVSYSRPVGLAVLVNGPGGLSRVGRNGSAAVTYPDRFARVGTYSGTAIYTPDGTEIVLGTESGLALVGNNGTMLAQLPVPGTATECSAERWWQPGVVLASCFVNSRLRLWLVPISGAAPTALTAAPKPPDLGDEDAWRIGAGTYVQDSGGCGYQYVAKLDANSTTVPVDIPGLVGRTTLILGTFGDELAVQGHVACGSGTSLVWFDPVANTTTVLMGPPLNGGGVIQALEDPRDES